MNPDLIASIILMVAGVTVPIIVIARDVIKNGIK